MSTAIRPFLTARFEHLTLFTWRVPDRLLERRLPRGLELDRRGGQPCVSLVTLDFKDTRVLGVRWPGYREFPDVNLRFYVKKGPRRGVVFIRELVPQRIVAAFARALYGEPFDAADVASNVRADGDRVRVERAIGYAHKVHTVFVEAGREASLPSADSDEHFFMEREWGFAHRRDGETSATRVVHPPWHVHPVRRAWLSLDWGAVYGQEWDLLTDRPPDWVALARGSEVSVYPPVRER